MYRFTNKETGEVKFGVSKVFGEGFEIFTVVKEDGTPVETPEEIRVENVEMDGSNLTNETYTVEHA